MYTFVEEHYATTHEKQQTNDQKYNEIYARVDIVVTFLVVNIFSCLIIASYGGGVMTWEVGELLCLLYLPIPIRGQNSSNRP